MNSRYVKNMKGKTYYHLDTYNVKKHGDAEKRVLKRAGIPFSTVYNNAGMNTELFVAFDFGEFSASRIDDFRSRLMLGSKIVGLEVVEGDARNGFEKNGSMYRGKYHVNYSTFVRYSSFEKPDEDKYGRSMMGEDAVAIAELVKGAKDLKEYIY